MSLSEKILKTDSGILSGIRNRQASKGGVDDRAVGVMDG